jgi:type IV secretory pathway VirB10-like protein
MPPRAARRDLTAAALSVAAHLALLFAFLATRQAPPPAPEVQPMAVALVAPGPTEQPKGPATPAPPAAQPPPPKQLARPTKARPDIRPLPAGEGRSKDAGVELSEAQIAGAAVAGSGGGGRPCDMARRLQAALRKDARVQAAVAEAQGSTGKALYVWNGDWVRSSGQDGNGLAAVREAIMWEVGFAPEACRAEPMHGLLAMSLGDGPGASRLVLGAGDWRWKDLLRPRAGG